MDKTIKKRAAALMLALSMTGTLIPANILAAEDTESVSENSKNDNEEAKDKSKTSTNNNTDLSSLMKEETKSENETDVNSEKPEMTFLLGGDSLVNTGTNNGFSEENKVNKDDEHYGWSIGKFYISGYSRVSEGADGEPIFIMDPDQNLKLSFVLSENINNLNGKHSLSINNVTHGSDQKLNVEEQNFGRGTLIVQYTDFKGDAENEIISDFLTQASGSPEDISIDLDREGDYKVALDYEIKKEKLKFFNDYYDYRISFDFQVRSGDSTAYPTDISTHEDLSNNSATENGFYLDLSKSRYVDVSMSREVLDPATDTLVLDEEFEQSNQANHRYKDEGVYTITVHNPYTNETNVEKIYVGKDKYLKASVITGMSLNQIKKQIDQGYTITDDGELLAPDHQTSSSLDTLKQESANKQNNSNSALYTFFAIALPIAIFILVLIGCLWIVKARKKAGAKKALEKDLKEEKEVEQELEEEPLAEAIVKEQKEIAKDEKIKEEEEIIAPVPLKDYEQESFKFLNMDEEEKELEKDLASKPEIDEIEKSIEIEEPDKKTMLALSVSKGETVEEEIVETRDEEKTGTDEAKENDQSLDDANNHPQEIIEEPVQPKPLVDFKEIVDEVVEIPKETSKDEEQPHSSRKILLRFPSKKDSQE